MERLQCGPFPLWTTGLVTQCDFTCNVQLCVHDCGLVLCASSLCSGHGKSMSAVWNVFHSSLEWMEGGFQSFHTQNIAPPLHRNFRAPLQLICMPSRLFRENSSNPNHSMNATSRHWFAYIWNRSAMTLSLFCLCLSAMCSSRSPSLWNSWIRGPRWRGWAPFSESRISTMLHCTSPASAHASPARNAFSSFLKVTWTCLRFPIESPTVGLQAVFRFLHLLHPLL